MTTPPLRALDDPVVLARAAQMIRMARARKLAREAGGLDAVLTEMRVPLECQAREDPGMTDPLNRDPTPIAALGLATRTQTCLRRAGIDTVGQLLTHTDADLLDIQQFGVGSLADVTAALAVHGHTLTREDLMANLRASLAAAKQLREDPR